MAIKDEDLFGVSSRKAHASLRGFDTAVTYKLTADVKGGLIPADSPVVIAADGTAKVYAEAAPESVGATDRLALLMSDRVSDADGNLNAAVNREPHVHVDRLPEPAQATVKAAPASALSDFIIEGFTPAGGADSGE